jgi:hypothetical protein
MRESPEHRGFLAAHAAIAEVDQLEVDVGGRPAAFQMLENQRATRMGERRDRDGIPHLGQPRLDVVREPRHDGVGVLDREQDVPLGDVRALGDRADMERQESPMLVDDVLPAGAVEEVGVT